MTQPRTSIGRNFQETTLERLAQRHQVTTIYLRNRMSLRGRIRDFDPYVVILEPLDGSPALMVYKSAIVSVAGPPRSRRPGPPGRDHRGPGGEGRPYGEGRPHGPRPDRPEGYGHRPEGGEGYHTRPPRPEGYGPRPDRPEGYGPRPERPQESDGGRGEPPRPTDE